jgi:hypothetical protein
MPIVTYLYIERPQYQPRQIGTFLKGSGEYYYNSLYTTHKRHMTIKVKATVLFTTTTLKVSIEKLRDFRDALQEYYSTGEQLM